MCSPVGTDEPEPFLVLPMDTNTLDVEELPIGAEVLAVGVDETSEMVWAYVGTPVGPTPVS